VGCDGVLIAGTDQTEKILLWPIRAQGLADGGGSEIVCQHRALANREHA